MKFEKMTPEEHVARAAKLRRRAGRFGVPFPMWEGSRFGKGITNKKELLAHADLHLQAAQAKTRS